MADYNNAVVFYDASGIEYSNRLKKLLKRVLKESVF